MVATGVNKMVAMVFFSGVLPWVFFVDLDGCHKCVVALKIACLVLILGYFEKQHGRQSLAKSLQVAECKG